MSAGGLSAARLGRRDDILAAHVERGECPGLVAVVSRHGEAHVDAFGSLAVGGDAPMAADTLFRITSMTKPIVAVAALVLVEECVLRLDDAVDGLLPELADRRVLRDPSGPLDVTVPAARSVTLRDLLTFRFGFGMDPSLDAGAPILRAVDELELRTLGPPLPAISLAPDEWLARLGSLPLLRQPGEAWLYGTSAHVLGTLVARAAGQPLETFLRERIFEPLGMVDTAFQLPPDKLRRLATQYDGSPDAATGELVVLDGVEGSQWATPPLFPDGAAGLVSTAADCLAFGELLLGDGRRGDVRLLARPTVEAMRTDQLTAAQRDAIAFDPAYWQDHGWGFGVSVVLARRGAGSTPGRFGWDGGYGTSLWVDPTEDLVGILLTQRAAYPGGSAVHADFWTATYQAIDD